MPLAMQGKDILARARTGSGKTMAYAMPIVQKILLSKDAVKNVRLGGGCADSSGESVSADACVACVVCGVCCRRRVRCERLCWSPPRSSVSRCVRCSLPSSATAPNRSACARSPPTSLFTTKSTFLSLGVCVCDEDGSVVPVANGMCVVTHRWVFVCVCVGLGRS